MLAHHTPYSLYVTQPGFKQECSGSKLCHGIFAETDPPTEGLYEGAGKHRWKFLVGCTWLCCFVEGQFFLFCPIISLYPLPDAFVAVVPLHCCGFMHFYLQASGPSFLSIILVICPLLLRSLFLLV